ncbi:MAG TPA: hypothetical protein DCS21_03525 [Gammaproteobacteria bacterium]|nr:hypothetical protein [Gammaproteobacteria bacterium]
MITKAIDSLLRSIEIKSGQTLNRDFFIGLERWPALAGKQAAAPVLVYGGVEELMHRKVRVQPWYYIHTILGSG